jgi:hypothetical protein
LFVARAVQDLVALAVLLGDGMRLAGGERARPEAFGNVTDLRHDEPPCDALLDRSARIV